MNYFSRLSMIYFLLITIFSGGYTRGENYTNQYDQDVFCPISMENRILNRTGSQCVWSSVETVGRWIGEERLYNITKRGQCQGVAGPGSVSNVLNSLGVKFKQAYGNKENGRVLIEQAMQEGKACVFGISGTHAMTLIHYDEDGNRVHFINNMGNKSIRIWTIKQFNKLWDGWIIVIESNSKELQEKLKSVKVCMWYYADST